ncbi:hypothetical protein HPP92_009174 [Vanilla planifolia]|uniref:Uncharacterized protein n=1 Tax=Vanilla planifolia TaxID=51239 RepID=A0A835RDS6_VANPL|nr:hypothetical protein HPP92_009174 [Vanilla planifolia]
MESMMEVGLLRLHLQCYRRRGPLMETIGRRVMDWEYFGCADELQGLIESMIADGVAPGFYGKQESSRSVSLSSTNCPGTPTEDVLPAAVEIGDEDMGLRLVHLPHGSGGGAHRGWEEPGSGSCDIGSAQGVAGRRQWGEHGAPRSGLLVGDATGGSLQEEAVQDSGEMLEAFQLLQDMSPYVKFGHFTANQAIMEAVGDDRRVHVVDFNIAEGAQWASLMQAFVSRKDGQQPLPHLRITAVMPFGAGRRSRAAVHQTGKRLTAFAASMGIPFSFGECRMGSDEQLRPER